MNKKPNIIEQENKYNIAKTTSYGEIIHDRIYVDMYKADRFIPEPDHNNSNYSRIVLGYFRICGNMHPTCCFYSFEDEFWLYSDTDAKVIIDYWHYPIIWKVKTKEICNICKGDGTLSASLAGLHYATRPCYKCNGKGFIYS